MTGIRACALGAALLICAGAQAGEVAPGDVNIVDGALNAALTHEPGDPVRGKEVFTGRKLGNCLACHQVDVLMDEQQFHGETGTPLNGIGDVYTAAELRARVVNPKSSNPDTMMPAFYRTTGFNRNNKKFEGKTILSAQQVEDVVAYLLTLKE